MLEQHRVTGGADLDCSTLPAGEKGESNTPIPQNDTVAALYNLAREHVAGILEENRYQGIALLAASIIVDVFARARIEHGAPSRMTPSGVKVTLGRNLLTPLPESVAQHVAKECANLAELGILVQKRGASSFSLSESARESTVCVSSLIRETVQRLMSEMPGICAQTVQRGAQDIEYRLPGSTHPVSTASSDAGPPQPSSRAPSKHLSDSELSTTDRQQHRLERVGRAYLDSLKLLEARIGEFVRNHDVLVRRAQRGFAYIMVSEHGAAFQELLGEEYQAVVRRTSDEMRNLYAAERLGAVQKKSPLKASDRLLIAAIRDFYPAQVVLELPDWCWYPALSALYNHMASSHGDFLELAQSSCSLIRNLAQHQHALNSILGGTALLSLPCITELSIARALSGIAVADRFCMGYVGFQGLVAQSRISSDRWQQEIHQAQRWVEEAIAHGPDAQRTPLILEPPGADELSGHVAQIALLLERVQDTLPRLRRLSDFDLALASRQISEAMAPLKNDAGPGIKTELLARPGSTFGYLGEGGASRTAPAGEFEKRECMRTLVVTRAEGLGAWKEVIGMIQKIAILDLLIAARAQAGAIPEVEAADLRKQLAPFREFIVSDTAPSRRFMEPEGVARFVALIQSSGERLKASLASLVSPS